MIEGSLAALAILAVGGLALVLWEQMRPASSAVLAGELAILLLAAAVAALLGLRGASSPQTVALTQDGLGRVGGALLLGAAILGLLLPRATPNARQARARLGLLLWSLCGGLLALLSQDLALLWVGLLLFLLAGAWARQADGEDASLLRTRLLIAPALLGLGIGLVMLSAGTPDLTIVRALLWQGTTSQPTALFAGLALCLASVALATGLLPPYGQARQHQVTAGVLGTILLARLGLVTMGALAHETGGLLAALGALAALAGGLGALLARDWPTRLRNLATLQKSYLLLALAVASSEAGLAAWLTTTLAYLLAQSTLCALCAAEEQPEAAGQPPGAGWLRTQPLYGAPMLIAVLSLMGLMFTLGFTGRFQLLVAAQRDGAWFTVAAVLLASVLGAVGYVPLILGIFQRAEEPLLVLPRPEVAGSIGLALAVVSLIALGLLRAPMTPLVRWIAGP
jgi:NADH:ubiquinone oxidoreductase subunit 2 (subunit N)